MKDDEANRTTLSEILDSYPDIEDLLADD